MKVTSFSQLCTFLYKYFNKRSNNDLVIHHRASVTTVGIMNTKRYALIGVIAAIIIVVAIAYGGTTNKQENVPSESVRVRMLNYQLEQTKEDNRSTKSELTKENEKLKALEEERFKLERRLK